MDGSTHPTMTDETYTLPRPVTPKEAQEIERVIWKVRARYAELTTQFLAHAVPSYRCGENGLIETHYTPHVEEHIVEVQRCMHAEIQSIINLMLTHGRQA